MNKSQEKVVTYIHENRDALIGFLRDLIRIPSVNYGAVGGEGQCQEFVAEKYRELGLEVDMFSPDSVPGITGHPGFLPGRDYRERPDVVGICRSDHAKSSVMLAGHIDVMPEGNHEDWKYGPFSGAVENGKIYGRGACDDKYAIAASYFALKAILNCNIPLSRDVCLASVVDEENGGGNGSLAVCLKYPCDEYLYIDGAEQATIAGVGGSVMSIDVVAVKPVSTAIPVYNGIRILVKRLEGLENQLAGQLTADPLYADAECAKHPLRLFQLGIGEPIGSNYNRGRLIYTIYSFDSKSELEERIQHILDDLNEGELRAVGLRTESPVWTTRYFDQTRIPADSPVVVKYRQAYQMITGKELPIGCSVLSDFYLYNNYGRGYALMTGLSRPFFEPECPHNVNESNDIVKVISLACSIAVYLLIE